MRVDILPCRCNRPPQLSFTSPKALPSPLVPVNIFPSFSPSRPPLPIVPSQRSLRHPPRHFTTTSPVMSSSSAQLRSRISTVESAEKIVSALRLVAAARIRSSSNAALRARPFAEELQAVLAQLIRHINSRGIDVVTSAQSAPPFTLSDMHGPLLADPSVQKALLDRMYLAVLSPYANPSSLNSASAIATKTKTILTVVTSDRKFCGSYNKDVITKATMRIRELLAAGTTVDLILVGRVAATHFNRHGSRPYPGVRVRTFIEGPTSPTAESTAQNLSQTLLSEFIGGGVNRVEIIYTRFVSLITTVPSLRTLLPLTPTGLESLGDELFQLTVTSHNGRIIPTRVSSHSHSDEDALHHSHPDHHHSRETVSGGTAHNTMLNRALYSISDQEAILLLNSMLPMYFTSQLIRIIRESIASEQVSRLAAMTAATDNARELITNLRTQYNKQRQARITTEIIEVLNNTHP